MIWSTLDKLILLNENSLIPIFYNSSFYFVTNVDSISFLQLNNFFILSAHSLFLLSAHSLFLLSLNHFNFLTEIFTDSLTMSKSGVNLDVIWKLR